MLSVTQVNEREFTLEIITENRIGRIPWGWREVLCIVLGTRGDEVYSFIYIGQLGLQWFPAPPKTSKEEQKTWKKVHFLWGFFSSIVPVTIQGASYLLNNCGRSSPTSRDLQRNCLLHFFLHKLVEQFVPGFRWNQNSNFVDSIRLLLTFIQVISPTECPLMKCSASLVSSWIIYPTQPSMFVLRQFWGKFLRDLCKFK